MICLMSTMAFASTVTRTVSSTAGKNADVTVSLAVDMDPGETYYVIDEKLPTALTVTSASNQGDYTTTPGHIFWIVISGAADTTYTYHINTGSQDGTYTFTGTYGSEITSERAILGSTSLTVGAGGATSTLPTVTVPTYAAPASSGASATATTTTPTTGTNYIWYIVGGIVLVGIILFMKK